MLTAAEWQVIGTSLLVSSRAIAVALPLAAITAWLLTRRRLPGRTLLDAAAHAPLVLPPVVVGYALLLLFGVEGPVGRALEPLGIRLVFSSEGASLAAGIMAFPLMVRAVRLSIEAIDPGLELVARSLGAGFWDRLATVVLPAAAPGLLAAAVTGFAASLGEFGAVITFAANVPGETQTLPLAIYTALQAPGGEETALRLSLLSLGLALGALIVAEALLRYGRRRGGV